MLHLLHALIIWVHALSTTSKEKGRSCMMSQWESAGCTTAGNYVGLPNLSSPNDCCAACAANATKYGCYGWTFHQAGTISNKNVSMCYLSTHPRRKAGVKGATCGCRNQDCTGAAPTCRPIYRPPLSQRTPLPTGIKRQPNIVSVIVDDMGWDDTSIHNPSIEFTPHLTELKREGIVLLRHHTYMWCSPTRRAFLSGRYPAHISGQQAPTQSNYLPLQFSTLGEKLEAAGYESFFVGKGHLGYHTSDHLPVNRGFSSHLGYLGGGESYDHGCRYGGTGLSCPHRDMWHDHAPAEESLIKEDLYSTNFYTRWAVSRIRNRNASKPFWLHLPYQAVHAPYTPPPPWEMVTANVSFRDRVYASMLKVMDDGLANVTAAIKSQSGAWANTLFVLFADNGGDCGLPAQPGVHGQPGDASNYPLLGRKCTAFEGGTRVAALVSGGLVPASRKGTTNAQLMYVTDWYPTFCKLAGVDASDDWVDGHGVTRGIDGVDLWPTLRDGEEVTQLSRQWVPTTERSLLYADGQGHMWKLITSGNSWLQNSPGEFKANRFTPNGSQYMDPHNPCLPNATSTYALRSLSGGAAKINISASVGLSATVPPSCLVCSNSTPCLFEVLSDPTETTNLVHSPSLPPDLLATMANKLKSFAVYSPLYMTPEELSCYNCSGDASRWGKYVGPQCVHKSNATTTSAIDSDTHFSTKHHLTDALPGQQYTILNDTTLLYGAGEHKKILGVTPSMLGCSQMAAKAGAREWTWHDSTVNGFALKCVQRTDRVLAPQKRMHHFSGYIKSPSPSPSPSPTPSPSPSPSPSPLPPSPSPPSPPLPKFSWDTVPVFTHLGHPTPFSANQIHTLSRFPLITVEKYMGPFPLPAGEGEEDNVAAVAHAVKSLNPESKVLMYVNSQFAYPFYRLFEVADRGQYWVVNGETGKPFTHEVIDLNCSNPGRCPGKTVGYWDFQHEELQAAWVAACSNPKIDGCFVDGATSDPPFPPSQNATGYEHARAATLASIAAKSLVVINDKKYYDPAPPYPTAQGEFIETFSGSSVKWMQILNRTRHSMRQPRMILAHTGSRNDGLCHDGGDPSEGSRDLAAFLMVAEEHTYFGCSNWEDVPTWPQEYDKPLGQPLGPALQEPDGTWRRRFAHGTNCSINFETGKFSIDWAQA